jgi:8-oxo-dGTP pyrophosphatase MutT (NUDIX family)
MSTPTVTTKTRHLTASALVLDPHTERVLLIHHRLTGYWQCPGGHVDPDEAPHAAALREAYEETGVVATPWPATHPSVPGGIWHPTPIIVCEFPAPACDSPGWEEPAHRHIDLLYLATGDSSAPITPQLEEVWGARWVPLDQLTVSGIRPDVPVVAHLGWGMLHAADRPGVAR